MTTQSQVAVEKLDKILEKEPEFAGLKSEKIDVQKELAAAKARADEKRTQTKEDAEKMVNGILKAAVSDSIQEKRDVAEAVSIFGYKYELEVADDITSVQTRFLDKPLKQMEGGKDSFRDATLEGSMALEKLSPEKLNSPIRRLLHKIPYVGYSMSKYLKDYSSLKTVISDMFDMLRKQSEGLKADNVALNAEKDRIIGHLNSFYEKKELLETVIESLKAKITSESDQKTKDFLSLDVYKPLLDRLQAINAMIGVSEKAIITFGIVIEHNEKIIDSCHFASTVTKSKVYMAALVAVAQEQSRAAMKTVDGVIKLGDHLDQVTDESMKKTQKELEEFEKKKLEDAQKLVQGLEVLKATIAAVQVMTANAIPGLEQNAKSMNQVLTVYKDLRENEEKKRALKESGQI